MEINLAVSSIQLKYLDALRQWRILNVKNLFEYSNYEASYMGFKKMLRNLEAKKVIDSFIDPFSKKKYVFLTKVGDDLIGAKYSSLISKETLIHDAKVIELIAQAQSLKSFTGFTLEHEIIDSKPFSRLNIVCPDAILLGEMKGEKLKVALELELTRKTKSKYIAKVQQYLSSSYYDLVMYVFQNEGVLKSYKRTLKEEIGVSTENKILYVLSEDLMSNKFNFLNSVVFFRGREGRLDELF